jgi:hypothetical protein
MRKEVEKLLVPMGSGNDHRFGNTYKLAKGARSSALEEIANAIAGEPGDPGPLYDLPERVRRVVSTLRARSRFRE